MKFKIQKMLGAFIACSVLCVTAQADTGATVPQKSDAQCEDLAKADFSGIQDAPTAVTEAKRAGVSDDLPPHCRVAGYVTPNVGFELLLPDKWNGKFLHVGCGGFCGVLSSKWGACDDPIRRGYACLASDLGHKSTFADAKWAFNNLQAKMDFGYRATHVATLAGKAITAQHYAHAPKRSYFLGCSTGGKQGLMEAQRFPWDFDGIVAGAPSINELGDAMAVLWITLAFLDKDHRALLKSEDFKLIHSAVLEACDRNDGVKDGLIGDPRRCAVNLGKLKCASNGTESCLSSEQLAAVQKIYSGPVTSGGERLYSGGATLGSELHWLLEGPGLLSLEGMLKYLTEQFRYTAFYPDPGPAWKVTDFDFERDSRRLGLMEPLYSPTNPDLRQFKAAGGKLMLYHGWSDILVMPSDSVDYYETVERTMGGQSATQDFFRLFMLPGVAHCGGGEGADTVDYLSSLEAWVEHGQAPDKLIGAHLKTDGVAASMKFPLNSPNIEFSRPLYPYPLTAKYLGHGDPKDASSFGPVRP